MPNRLNKLLNSVSLSSKDAIVIFSEVNVTYLSGFTGHAATLLITHDKSYLITDYRYIEQAESELDGIEAVCRMRQTHTLGQMINLLLSHHDIECIQYESDHISEYQWRGLCSELTITNVKPAYRLTEDLRYCKSADEINSIRTAAHIADDALAEVLAHSVKEGVTERDLTVELEYQMAKRGSEEIAFQTIMLFAERSARPHGVLGNKQLKKGDLLLFDFGAVVNGYRSDMTRTFCYGKADKKQSEIYNLVLEAQLAAINAVEVGVSGAYLHQQADDVLKVSPYAEYRSRGLGHGLGLDVHEQPFMMPGCDQTIENGCVVTIEPGIYIPGWGGIRIEDDVVLIDSELEILNKTPKDQFEL
jgi:Xaa-Pro aminopeptidase/Xaa-Pro dipeptidase